MDQMNERDRRERERREAAEVVGAIAGIATIGAGLFGAFKLAQWGINQVTSSPDEGPGPSRPYEPSIPYEPSGPSGPSRPFRLPRQPAIVQAYSGDRLSTQIQAKYDLKKQGWKTTQFKEKIRAELEEILERAYIPCLTKPINVQYLGSSKTKELALDDSDLDLCIKLHKPLAFNVEKKATLEKIALVIYDELKEPCTRPKVFGKLILMQFQVVTPSDDYMKVDMQMYTPAAENSTNLIAHYIKADTRFQKLSVILKLWAREYGIYGTEKGLSSYALNLMLIHYLQVACNPPVLPCFHKSHPNIFKGNPNPNAIRNFHVNFESRNSQNLGDLLIGFFRYYTQDFDFRKMAVTVADNSLKLRSKCDWLHDSAHIFVEEPFSSKNMVIFGSIRSNFDKIVSSLEQGHRVLVNDRDLDNLLRSSNKTSN